MSGREPGKKGPDAFRTIGEAAQEVGVAPHVLRFWETKFPTLRPLKRGGSRRYYRPRDIELLHRIRRLVHEEGYTIKGAAKALRAGADASEKAAAEVAEPLREPPLPFPGDAPGETAVVYDFAGLKRSLEALAAECAAVAAGNSPPPRSD